MVIVWLPMQDYLVHSMSNRWWNDTSGYRTSPEIAEELTEAYCFDTLSVQNGNTIRQSDHHPRSLDTQFGFSTLPIRTTRPLVSTFLFYWISTRVQQKDPIWHEKAHALYIRSSSYVSPRGPRYNCIHTRHSGRVSILVLSYNNKVACQQCLHEGILPSHFPYKKQRMRKRQLDLLLNSPNREVEPLRHRRFCLTTLIRESRSWV